MNQLDLDPRPRPDNTRSIPLSQGQFAIVDSSDYERLNRWKWYAQWNPKTRSFYAARTAPTVNGKCPGTVWMHRDIMGLERGDRRQVDHIKSGETLNNSRSNLRIATHAENMHNRRVSRSSASGFKGVGYADGKWKAEIVVNGKWIYLGVHATPELAHAAYCEAAKRYHGEFASSGERQ